MGGLVPQDASSGRRTAVASWLPETGNRGARGGEGPAGKRVKSSSSGRRARIAGAWGVGGAPSCRASTVSCTRSQSERARPASRLTAGRVAGARRVQPGPARLPQTAASAAQRPLRTASRRPGASVRYFKSFSACQTEHEEAYQLTPQRDARGPHPQPRSGHSRGHAVTRHPHAAFGHAKPRCSRLLVSEFCSRLRESCPFLSRPVESYSFLKTALEWPHPTLAGPRGRLRLAAVVRPRRADLVHTCRGALRRARLADNMFLTRAE